MLLLKRVRKEGNSKKIVEVITPWPLHRNIFSLFAKGSNPILEYKCFFIGDPTYTQVWGSGENRHLANRQLRKNELNMCNNSSISVRDLSLSNKSHLIFFCKLLIFHYKLFRTNICTHFPLAPPIHELCTLSPVRLDNFVSTKLQ